MEISKTSGVMYEQILDKQIVVCIQHLQKIIE